tara:strand:+ start:1133 stop:1297 length:165 start_codon:yes stop_codon:yes gene_type:complete
MTGVTFGPDGISECESCGKKFNSVISSDFSGKLCNKCHNAKKAPKQETEESDDQ